MLRKLPPLSLVFNKILIRNQIRCVGLCPYGYFQGTKKDVTDMEGKSADLRQDEGIFPRTTKDWTLTQLIRRKSRAGCSVGRMAVGAAIWGQGKKQ
jgi:hypothetical protein